MRRELSILILMSLVLFLSGCLSSGGSSSAHSYMSGTDGISMSFVYNNPPDIVYLDDTYSEDTPIEIEAFNRGTSPSSNVETFFVGFDDNIISIPNVNIDFSGNEEYKTRYNPEGGYDADSTTMSVGDLGNTDTYQFNLKLMYCYDYDTIAGVQLCVDPNPNRENKDDACTPSSVSTNGQGAPIGIESVDMESMPGNVRLKINVKHYGQGVVLKSSAQCRGISLNEDEDYIEFTNPTLGGISGNCITDSPLKLRNGKGSLICNFPLDSSESSYSTILELELYNYKIKDSVQKTINIINEDNTI